MKAKTRRERNKDRATCKNGLNSLINCTLTDFYTSADGLSTVLSNIHLFIHTETRPQTGTAQ